MTEDENQPSDSDGYDGDESENQSEAQSWPKRTKEALKIAVLSGDFIDHLGKWANRILELLL